MLRTYFLPAFRTLVGCLLLISGLLTIARAQEEESVAPARCWALLIGCEKYQKAPQLQFTVNDVRQLAETLVNYGRYLPDQIAEISDEQEKPENQPLKQSLEAALPKFLAKPQKGDTIIVYFSGHGFRDAEGKLYLAPLDCDPANAAATGVSAEWFRGELEKCQAGFKLLILDACHAGAEKGEEPMNSVAAKDLGELFKTSAGVTTLASSAGDEKSQIWQFKQQSLFSYWLKEGLKGHADRDDDADVDIDELFSYVYDRVRQTAEIRLRRQQTPARNNGLRQRGVPLVVKLKPQKLKQLVSDMAEQIAGLIEERQLASVGVLEFSDGSVLGREQLGGDFGLLGKYCAKELERGLLQRSAGKFSIVDQARLQKAIQEQHFSLVSLESNEKMARLSKSVGDMPVLIKGSFTGRAGREITLRGKMLETQGDKSLADVGGLAVLSESEWAMLGRSAIVANEDRQRVPDRPIEAVVVERLDARAEGAHPLLDPKGEFRVNLVVKGKVRTPVFQGNQAFVTVKQGEVYELEIQHRKKQIVMAKVLVDGLNTLPQTEKDAKGVETLLIAPRVSLDEARAWVLDPNRPGVLKKDGFATWAFRGFVTQTGVAGKLKEFLVVDAAQSLAARQQYTEQVGLITVGFFLPQSSARDPGTDLGQERNEVLKERDDVVVGPLLGVIHLRYIDAPLANTPSK